MSKYAIATARDYGKKRSRNASAKQAKVIKKLKKTKTRPGEQRGFRIFSASRVMRHFILILLLFSPFSQAVLVSEGVSAPLAAAVQRRAV